MKYYAHIVSHSHWDREWYMPYEKHHMLLVELLDDVLNQIKIDGDFKSFHLDGHVLPVLDYLAVRPEKKDEIKSAIKSGKIKIGPWFILQDAFLTSAEANIRNLQYGIKLATELGGCEYLGYYPDTFGIYSQAAQILKSASINNMFFGRGVTPTGFNNQVATSYTSQFSEMAIESPSGDKVLGILFANWYSNGNEIPTDKVEAKKWWDQKLGDASKFAKTKHLLFMNGCDHQPLQKDITKAIKVANELYDDVEFIHSNLTDYYNLVSKECDLEELDTIQGELKSQNTDGYYSLVNTASSRVHQKISNNKAQDLLEKYVEPLGVMLGEYDHDKIEYAWKLLMENHPHDSICGCSCDKVHDKMDIRFEDVIDVSSHLVEKQLNTFKKQGINASQESLATFTIFNSLGVKKANHSQKIIYQKFYFDECGYSDALKNAKEFDLVDVRITDSEQNIIDFDILNAELIFDYDLPDDQFRRPYYAKKITVKILDVILPFSYKSYFINNAEKLVTEINQNFSNEFIDVKVNNDGSFELYDIASKTTFKKLGLIIDHADLGNEYMFGEAKNDINLEITKTKSKIEYQYFNTFKICTLKGEVEVPVSAVNETFLQEKIELRSFYNRNSKRETKLVKMPIEMTYKLENNSRFVNVNIKLKNMAKDHRMRYRFECNEQIKNVQVDSIFDVVDRPVAVSEFWKHTSNDHQLSKFISLKQDNQNLIIATNGLQEYEAKSNYVDLTLLRCTSEMGDWGYFPTPGAQLLEKNLEFEISVGLFEDQYVGYDEARFIHNQTVGIQIENLKGKNPVNHSFIKFEKTPSIAVSSLKQSFNNETVLRVFGLKKGEFKANINTYNANILEEKTDEKFDGIIKDNEIKTLIIERN